MLFDTVHEYIIPQNCVFEGGEVTVDTQNIFYKKEREVCESEVFQAGASQFKLLMDEQRAKAERKCCSFSW